MIKKITINVVLLLLGFLILNVDKANAVESSSYCVCSYASISSFGGACPTELSQLAFLESDSKKCVESAVKKFVETVPGDSMCKFGSCEIKLCNSYKDLLKGSPVQLPGITDDWSILSACVPPADYSNLDDCAKKIAGKDCSLKTKDISGKDTDISVCEASCTGGCNYENNACVISCFELTKGMTASTPEGKKDCETICTASPHCLIGDGACACVPKIDGGDAKPGLTAEEQSTMSAEEMKAYLQQTHPVPDGYVGALPPCAFYGTCRNINDLTQLLVNFGKGMFAIMGSFAFAFFVYGGFTMIVSMGNAEKQKKGMQILVSAVIGIVIAFSAYMIINFMLEALDVAQDFRGIK